MVRMPDKRAGAEVSHPYWRKGGKWMKEPRTIPPLTTTFVGWGFEVGAGR
jgi:hypothetical protein